MARIGAFLRQRHHRTGRLAPFAAAARDVTQRFLRVRGDDLTAESQLPLCDSFVTDREGMLLIRQQVSLWSAAVCEASAAARSPASNPATGPVDTVARAHLRFLQRQSKERLLRRSKLG